MILNVQVRLRGNLRSTKIYCRIIIAPHVVYRNQIAKLQTRSMVLHSTNFVFFPLLADFIFVRLAVV